MVTKTSPGASCDEFVRSLLVSVDYTTLCLLLLAIVSLAAIVFRIRHGKAAEIQSLIRVVEACALVFSGCLVAMVFLFTDPPAVALLSHESRALAGICSLLVSIHVAIDTFRSAIWGKRGRSKTLKAKSCSKSRPNAA